jgi:SAM-dependent methyltransferase
MASWPSGKRSNTLSRKFSSFIFRLHFLKHRLNDWSKGVDFSSAMNKADAGISGDDDAVYYDSTAFAPELTTALNYLSIKEGDSVVDFGCGKGAVLAKFARYPFSDIYGIDLSPVLIRICEANLRKLGLDRIHVRCIDASRFMEMEQITHFYFANPFVGKTFQTVVRNIIDSYDRNPREICLIYYHPVCHELIEDTRRFELIKKIERGARLINIYKIKPHLPL